MSFLFPFFPHVKMMTSHPSTKHEPFWAWITQTVLGTPLIHPFSLILPTQARLRSSVLTPTDHRTCASCTSSASRRQRSGSRSRGATTTARWRSRGISTPYRCLWIVWRGAGRWGRGRGRRRRLRKGGGGSDGGALGGGYDVYEI